MTRAAAGAPPYSYLYQFLMYKPILINPPKTVSANALPDKAKGKKLLVSVWALGWEIFSDDSAGNFFFETTIELKKYCTEKENWKKRKKNGISWKNKKKKKKKKMLGRSSLLTFFIYIYKSQIHMFQLV